MYIDTMCYTDRHKRGPPLRAFQAYDVKMRLILAGVTQTKRIHIYGAFGKGVIVYNPDSKITEIRDFFGMWVSWTESADFSFDPNVWDTAIALVRKERGWRELCDAMSLVSESVLNVQ